jgi:hypothetical protein
MASTIYLQCIYGYFGREITKYAVTYYAVTYGAYIYTWFWPTLDRKEDMLWHRNNSWWWSMV